MSIKYMYQYNTVSEAINDLRRRGYVEDFNLEENALVCKGRLYHPDDFEIHEVFRFEGDSDPGDEAVVYGIESVTGHKGILVNGYGYSSEAMGDEIARKLSIQAH